MLKQLNYLKLSPKAMALLFLIAAIPAFAGQAQAQPHRISELTVFQARDMIQNSDRPMVVMIYAARCSRSRRIFNDFNRRAAEWREQGVSVLALATDRSAERLKSYLDGKNLSFEPYRLIPWKKGTLDKAMSQVGLEIGRTFKLPLLAVFNAEGRVVLRDEGAGNLRKAGQAVEDLTP
jgi:hypothetical protein